MRTSNNHNNNNMNNGGGMGAQAAAIIDNNNNQVGNNVADQQSFMTGTGEHNVAQQNIKNQRKAAMAARMRPRSQTGNVNAKNANLF